jgi:hypothetical protein
MSAHQTWSGRVIPFKQIRIAACRRIGNAQAGLGIKRFQAHLAQEPAHPLDVDGVAQIPQVQHHSAHALFRVACVLTVQQLHQREVFGALFHRFVVKAGAMQPQQLTLPADGKTRMFQCDHRTTLLK